MSDFDDLMREMDATICETMGAPATFIRQADAARLPTTVVVEKDVEVMGQFVDTVELRTQASLPVADVGIPDSAVGFRDSVLVFEDMSYHIRRLLSNDGSMLLVELLPDPELHVHLKALEPLGHINQFINHEWAELWQTISTHRSAL